ncbi:MAG: 16S rRNA (guanine(527)-N(7))-methyltransferase RsmG [Clostridia bacterium]|nr:16S rRNA (guanine(527)-N(7))-methyltransferase RsmG [Clostridia bacterium]
MEKLINFLEQLNISLSEDKINKFTGYMEDILELNEHINLTAITDKDEFIKKHYMDSVSLAKFVEISTARRILDLGTGAGFPGVPLAIIYPEKEFVLVDSLNKRLKIIATLCEKYHIKNVTVVHARAEELARKEDFRDSFDLCVSRAVASMPVLLEYCLPFVKTGGKLISYKGPEVEEELEKSARALKLLQGKVEKIEKTSLDEHNLVFVEKLGPTPKAYPRKPGTPSKEPL